MGKSTQTQQQNLTCAEPFHLLQKGQVACNRGLRPKHTEELMNGLKECHTLKDIFLKILILYHIITECHEMSNETMEQP